MSSSFEILELPVRLVVDPDSVESAWREKAKSEHPDAESNSEGSAENFSADLNRARQILLDPALRLEHWLQVHEVENTRTSSLDEDTMSLFSLIGDAISAADAAIEKQKSATTALGKAVNASEAIKAQLGIQKQLGSIRTTIESAVDSFNELENSAAEQIFSQAVKTLAKLRFLKKWEAECQKRLLDLIAL